jgi:hypothetical protein
MNRPEIMQYFAHAHLPPHLAGVSKRFADLAESCLTELPPCEERDVFLRKLLEAKDAAVRARLFKTFTVGQTVKHNLDERVGDVVAIDGVLVTVRWAGADDGDNLHIGMVKPHGPFWIK